MRLDHAGQHVTLFLTQTAGGDQHLPRLADARGSPQEDLEAPLAFLRRRLDQRIGVGTVVLLGDRHNARKEGVVFLFFYKYYKV